jgi:hypothetical protein
LKKWKESYDKIIRDDSQVYKELTRATVLWPDVGVGLSEVVAGFELEKPRSVVLPCIFEIGTFIRKFIFAAIVVI